MSPTPLHRSSIGPYGMKVFWFFFLKKNGRKRFFLKKEAKTSDS
jgi:hypothetical protein